MQGNILTMECAQGVMQIVPYADNILHFVYYPQNDSSCLTEETDGREKLPLWGIEAVQRQPLGTDRGRRQDPLQPVRCRN